MQNIEQEAKDYFLKPKGSHDWDHTLRVYNLCIHIGKKENANLEILKLAALLHDIKRYEEDQSREICHAEKGAILAKEILKKHNYEETKINKIANCIETHRYRDNNQPESKEAKVLFDADKLDSIGAVGIGRAFLFSGEIGAKLHNKDIQLESTKPYTKEDTAYREFLIKLKDIKEKMLTNEGKRIAEERHIFMNNFFIRLNKEVDGDL
jgi:uncharacterized protein